MCAKYILKHPSIIRCLFLFTSTRLKIGIPSNSKKISTLTGVNKFVIPLKNYITVRELTATRLLVNLLKLHSRKEQCCHLVVKKLLLEPYLPNITQ